MIDTSIEKVFPVAETPPHLVPGRGGRPVHAVTLGLWWRRGIRGVRLETLVIGGQSQGRFSAPSGSFYRSPRSPLPPPVTPGTGDAAGLRMPPECVICETLMEPTAPDYWMCQECRSECYIPGGQSKDGRPRP